MLKVHSLVAALALLAAPALSGEAFALPMVRLTPAPLAAPVEKTNYFYEGRDYCFYPDGWRGPGFYLCGFPYRRGFYFAPGFFRYGRGGGHFRGGSFGGYRFGGHSFGGGHGGRPHFGGGHHGGFHQGRGHHEGGGHRGGGGGHGGGGHRCGGHGGHR